MKRVLWSALHENGQAENNAFHATRYTRMTQTRMERISHNMLHTKNPGQNLTRFVKRFYANDPGSDVMCCNENLQSLLD